MAQVSLSKVLKYKKRVSAAISRVSRDIQSHNVVTHDASRDPEREVDIRQLQKDRKRLVDHLVTIKTLLMSANQPIYGDIFRLSELKGTIAFLEHIGTSHGPMSRYSKDDTPQKQSAEIRKAEVDEQIVKLEMDIDQIQDKLDEFNAMTKIEVANFGMVNEIKAGSSGNESQW